MRIQLTNPYYIRTEYLSIKNYSYITEYADKLVESSVPKQPNSDDVLNGIVLVLIGDFNSLASPLFFQLDLAAKVA